MDDSIQPRALFRWLHPAAERQQHGYGDVLEHVVDVVLVVDQGSAVAGQRVPVASEQLLEPAVVEPLSIRGVECDEHDSTS